MDAARKLLGLPRSVLLALWAHRVGEADVDLRAGVAAVQGDDEPHEIDGPHDFGPAGGSLADLLVAWAGASVVVGVVPAPDDSLGLPDSVAAPAMAAGECVLATGPTGAWAAVPHVRQFGSALEPGHVVTWLVTPVRDWEKPVGAALGGIDRVDAELREALLHATQALGALDVEAWSPEAAGAIATIRSPRAVEWDLPRGLTPRAEQALVTAARLRAIVALATADDDGEVLAAAGTERSRGSVPAFDVLGTTRDRVVRAQVLADVDRVARRAMSAATLPG